MRTFYTNDFEGHYPVGTAAVAKAKDKRTARRLIDGIIRSYGLDPKAKKYTLHELDANCAVVLNDGNY